MSIPTWEEAAEEEFWARVPQDLHEGEVKHYLGIYGDAIESRIRGLRSCAADLLSRKFLGSSVVTSVTAMEVMIEYFCVRPIVGGALLSDLLAREVSEHLLRSRSSDQRRLLAAILRPWEIDLASALLPDRRPLWDTFQNSVMKKRNGFVHRGDEVLESEAALGLDCCSTFRSEIVLKIAARLGFSIHKTGCWARVEHDAEPECGRLGGGTYYTACDPFK